MPQNYTIHPRGGTGERIDFRTALNDQQFEVVTCPPGAALVIAGAGSGKTRTLIYRVAYLLANGIAPENILLLTFTNKAAREMLNRVETLLGSETSRLWGGTFHSIANRLLRRHAGRIGFKESFSILDREDQKELLGAAIGDSGIDPRAVRFPKPDVLANIFSLAANLDKSVSDVISHRYPYFAHLTEEIVRVADRYIRKKAESHSMDFDDLLGKSLELLRANPDLVERYQYQFQFILVDEYQDTNRIQADFIVLLAGRHGNLMVVGDDAQSIYSWRGADFRNILEFPKRYPKARTFKIESNYRSAPEILRFSNAAISPNTRQFKKTLKPVRLEGALLPAVVPLADPGTQAAFVAQRILELREEGFELGEIAVLYRAHFHSMEIQMELTTRGIPFRVTSGLKFFEQAHVKDVAAFMRFAINRRDEVAFKRIVRLLPGIGGRSAEKFWLEWAASGAADEAELRSFSEPLSQIRVPRRGKEGWNQLGYTLDELLGDEAAKSPRRMITSILEGVYEDYMRGKFTNFDSRRQDLEQLINYAGEFDSVPEFLAQLALVSGSDSEPTAGEERDEEAVCLSSVHQAKGLEWRAVFIVWLTDGMFPNARVIENDEDQEGLEEERRLFYVAVTRAKDQLYLAYPAIWRGAHSGDTIQRPSPFLRDIPEELFEEWQVGRGFF